MTEEPVVDYIDVSLVDRVHRRRWIYNDLDNSMTEQVRDDEVPEDLMSDLQEYIGDGLARVTVSAELKSSHEFYGAGSFVSISLTCNNNLDDATAVHTVLRPHVQRLVEKDYHEMSLLRDEILPANIPKLHNAPKGLPSGEKVGGPPKRSAKTVTKKKGGPKKPNFRR